MSTANRNWIMARRPKADDFDAALELASAPLQDLRDGDVLIRNIHLSMDAGTRMWMNAREDSYQQPTPVGSPVQGMVIGEVTGSRHPEYRKGDLVRAYGQWADFSIARPDEIYVARVSPRLDDLRQYVAVFGPNGWTAWVGVVECGLTKAGDTFVVSSAAGATGMLAGQVAKALGARVIGITGSDEKCAWITQDLGFDAAVNYKTQNVAAALRALCPDGIQVYYDNVAGEVLDGVLPNMALYGRVALCGLIANYAADEPVPGPYKFDMILMKRLTIVGFFSPDFYHRGEDINRRMRSWYESGQLRMVFDEVQGLENTVAAYRKLFTGANRGKVIVTL
jgi:NADPH-dependent curcumin reductase CurA